MAKRYGLRRALQRTFRRDDIIVDYVLASMVGGAVAWGTSLSITGAAGEFAERHRAAIVSSAGLLASTIFFIVKRSRR